MLTDNCWQPAKKLAHIISMLLTICFSSFSISSELKLVTLQYPPYSYEEDGVVKGIAVDTITEVFKRIGRPVNIKIYPWARAIKYIKTGEADAIFTIFRTAERERFASFSNEVLFTQLVSLYVAQNSDIEFSGQLENLNNYKIGAVRAVNYGSIFHKAINQNLISELDLVNKGEVNVKKLLASRIDIIVSNQLGAQFILNEMNAKDKVKALKPCLEKIPSYIAFSLLKNLESAKNEFDIELKKFKGTPDYIQILKKYGLIEQSPQDC